MKKINVQESSGNVFADLELPEPDEMLVKAELTRRISEIITKRHLTQVQAAELLGVDQPKISVLMRGKLTGFSFLLFYAWVPACNTCIAVNGEA